MRTGYTVALSTATSLYAAFVPERQVNFANQLFSASSRVVVKLTGTGSQAQACMLEVLPKRLGHWGATLQCA